jgi:hypothetical protein
VGGWRERERERERERRERERQRQLGIKSSAAWVACALIKGNNFATLLQMYLKCQTSKQREREREFFWYGILTVA